MTTPAPGLTVITDHGDFTVPSGQSWSGACGPDGLLLAEVYDGPFVDSAQSDPRAPASATFSGKIVASFASVQAVYPVGSVTQSNVPIGA